MRSFKTLLIIIGIVLLVPISGAQEKLAGLAYIEALLSRKAYKEADRMIKQDEAYWLRKKAFDTLVALSPVRAAATYALEGADQALPLLQDWTQDLQQHGIPSLALLKAYTLLAVFFENKARYKDAYTITESALKQAGQLESNRAAAVARSTYNLGVLAQKMGEIALSSEHHREALRLREAQKSPDPEELYFSYSAMGSIMWYALKYDSARWYYEQALTNLKKMPEEDINRYFRPAIIENNIAALYNETGNPSEAIRSMYAVIQNMHKFHHSETPHPKQQQAFEAWCEAIDNLGGIYRNIGNYGKAFHLLDYSYRQKKAKLDSLYPGIFISELLLGQYFNAINEPDSARRYLLRGLQGLEKSDARFPIWAADGWHTLALVHENQNQTADAGACYQKAEELYEVAYGGVYDNIYMEFLRNAAQFYAKNDQYPAAIGRAEKVFRYLEQVGATEGLQGFYQLLNMAEINFLAKRYNKAIQITDRALQLWDYRINTGVQGIDLVKKEFYKPKAILIKTQALYEMQPERDSAFLATLLEQLDIGLQILDRRKAVLEDDESLNRLMADHKALIDFSTRITLELYQKNPRQGYLEKFINLHESALYSRIRSRLEQEEALYFSNVPANVIDEEQQLKAAVRSALSSEESTSSMDKYLKSQAQWDAYLKRLESEHPRYYQMRFATIFKNRKELHALIPAQTTVVRYFANDSLLTALVADRQAQHLISLNPQGLLEKIDSMLAHPYQEALQLRLLHAIYLQIWAPLAPYIHNDKVMIIPDGALYNVGFDMLPTRPVTRFKGLKDSSLLSRHTFSYHYSLFMLQEHDSRGAKRDNTPASGSEEKPERKNYIAFAPVFSDDIKERYTQTVTDSLLMDTDYLSLLPQPNADQLTHQIKRTIGGTVYNKARSTREAFREKAGNHKIIHIATHARYDNIQPENSGLIFAKDAKGSDNNYLSLADIYSLDVRAKLTLLTACESGRPGYQDGEGLVSLAHAFNYAGSENILTALWSIDESSSAEISERFIHHLRQGKATDEALRLAKLDYLQRAEGRVLAPVYWSGLILMGQPGTIALKENKRTIWWILGGTVMALAPVLLYRRRRSRNAATAA